MICAFVSLGTDRLNSSSNSFVEKNLKRIGRLLLTTTKTKTKKKKTKTFSFFDVFVFIAQMVPLLFNVSFYDFSNFLSNHAMLNVSAIKKTYFKISE